MPDGAGERIVVPETMFPISAETVRRSSGNLPLLARVPHTVRRHRATPALAASALLAAFLLTLLPARADAARQTSLGFRGWGPRLGVTLSPDQFHVGVHADFGDISPRVRLQPNFELGFGDNQRVAAINMEGFYRFFSRWDVWNPYLGGGFGVNVWSFDSEWHHHGFSSSHTDIGLNILGGVEKEISNGNRFFTELKVGLIDSPDLKITFGWTFLQ